jgi:hypothetical protein
LDHQIVSIIKKALKISWKITVAVLTVLLTAAVLLQLPQVQTFIAGKVMEKLDQQLDADISIEKIHFKPFSTLVIKNVTIVDRNPVTDAADPTLPQVDTFFRAEYITATFSFESLFRHEGFHLNEADIRNAQMNLVLENKEDEGDGDVDTDNLSRIFRIRKPETPKRSEKEIFSIRKVRIEDMGFSMKDYGIKKVPYHGGINWNDLDVMDINLMATDLRFKAGVMSGSVEHLSFREKSGYRTEAMSGRAKVGRGKTIVEDLIIDDPWSDLQLPLFMMSYENIHAFKDFISLVKIDGVIGKSLLDFKTLTYFAPQLEGNRLKARISGKASGYVDDFDIIDFNVASDAGGFSGLVNGTMKGIPDIENTTLKANVRGLNFTAKGLGLFLSEWTRGKDLDLSRFAKGIMFMSRAKVNGNLNSLDIAADVSSLAGSIQADMKLKDAVSLTRPIGISGKAETRDIDLGRILGNEMLGPVTLRTGLKAEFGKATGITIDSLLVDRLHFNGYDYSGLMAAGALSEKMFNGTIIANDPNLNAWLQGGFAVSSKTRNARYQFYANVSDANLNALNFDKRGRSKLRFRTNANFTRTGKGNILGDIDIADLIFTNRDSTTNIGNINLTSHSNNDTYKIRLRSQFADGSFNGTAPVTRFIKDLTDVTFRSELPALFKSPEFRWEGNSYSLDISTHDSQKLLSFLLPGLYISDGTTLKLRVDKDGQMSTTLDSKRLALRADNLKDINVTVNNHNGRFSGELASQEATLFGFTLSDNSIKLLADDNHIGLSCSYDNHSEMDNRGELVINGDLAREGERLDVDISLLPSTLHFNSQEWNILPSSFKLKGKELSVDAFEVVSGDQRIYAFGKTSETSRDTLTFGLERFDISVLAPIIGPELGIRGIATGDVRITSPISSKGLLADIICDSTYVAGEPLGILTASSTWNEEFERFDLSLRNEHNGKKNIEAIAKLTPRTRMLDAGLVLDSLNIAHAEPFLTDVFSQMEGYISGNITAEGPVDMIEVGSEGTRLDKAMLKVAFTNVPYFADGNFHIDNSGVYFDDIRIRDRYNGTGTVNGSINWTGFKDFTFDTRMKISNMEGIDLTEELSKEFYGNLFGTGNVSITGPVNSLTLSVDAVTAKTGQLHIPMSSAATSAGRTNLLRFKEADKTTYIDPYEAMMARLSAKEDRGSDFFVKLRVEASPNVEAFVEIDKSSGNVLSGQGNGLIELEIGEDLFNINGDYTLTGGKYNFSALGLVNRVFDIQDGSSINFSGDIMQSTLDIKAIYTTKSSLSSLLADESSVGNRRNVECMINITDKLSNPRLEFAIEVPDLNPMIKSRVESALSTEDKIQKQFLSLLLSNSFLPDEQSGIVNNSSMFYSNVTEAMANQLSNILHKLNIPLDLGLKYQPTEQGTDLFDVAVSTQLFNNRVVVNGNIGNKQYEGGGAQNDVVGDLDIEIKLNRSGALRLNLFSHSADQYSNYLDNSQRNGVGLTYQTEFNSFRQLVRNIFSGKEKRQEAKLAEQEEALSGEKVKFSITKETIGNDRK